ncbi:MAG: glycogen/starch/alpha-glucan phosphorylase [Kiritimatiellae bacterium]|jgi:starch phosphorylase|nr:glycogen/starch/alpha-glucan phosphorylase [Kiritimatiellia bacterium]MDD4340993.1 glycogen/starch/alpha-glucan phosphorylase [Kiritimatiellia bacterium]
MSPAAKDHSAAAPDVSTNGDKRNTVEAIKASYLNHLKYSLAKDEFSATDHDRYYALALAVRDRLVDGWIRTSVAYHKTGVKRAYYLSMEYLMGRAMGNNVINLQMDNPVNEAMEDLGLSWDFLRDIERDAGLGNGGLGRLAACFLDSLATLQLPGYGYGVRYEYGIFRQEIKDGYQVEDPDHWLRFGNAWELERPESQFEVHFGGRVEMKERHGHLRARWVDYETVLGIPYDYPIPGYGNNTVNNLRLWAAKSTEEFNLTFFNTGDYMKAYETKNLTENITKVLYPNDNIEQGRELRFKQQYFFVACSLHDIVRRFKADENGIHAFPDKIAIQLNDTHPALAIAELMRILLDDEHLEWDDAWSIVTRTFGYTNHTLMPEALERWSVQLFESILPRHLQIIYEINRRFLREIATRYPGDSDRIGRMSLIQEEPFREVRMAYLAVVGSHSVNGVAALHSELLESTLFKDFYELWPEKFNNKTNGITPRRWLLKANPGLADLVTEKIGAGWITDLPQLKQLEAFADDLEFQQRVMAIKRENKANLAALIHDQLGVRINTDSIFDVQVKRLHEYKRQLLNVLGIIHQYFELKANPDAPFVPRTYLFAGKAAPGYYLAKLIIKLINDVASVINHDPAMFNRLNVVFLPDYRVSLAERIIPAADVSEQISTAGTEASGTGNMKFQLNGALTIGTLDGANIEIRQEVGADNFFLFGKTVEEVDATWKAGYNPWDIYQNNASIRRVLDAIKNNFFNLDQPGLYQPIWDTLLVHGDRYLVLDEFDAYVNCQAHLAEVFEDQARWARMCILNIANSGKFSTDRTIAEYAQDIWDIHPCPINGD